MSDINIDFEREGRQGFCEVVYGEAKSVEQLQRIVEKFQEKESALLVTRLQADKASELLKLFPAADYHPVGRTFRMEFGSEEKEARRGRVALVSAGTSDAPVVAESENVLSFMNISTQAFQDVGVAGIHRLMKVIPEVDKCDVVICFAGFEGALPSVLAGLTGIPVIAVPVSAGYGVARSGETALNAMLTSCANGITVVNIDNGYGAAMAAFRILNAKYS